MRNLAIPSQVQSILPQLGILTNVVELTHYDMLYVFRSLQEKSTLTLKRDVNHIFDNNAVEVYFNNRKLGYVSNKVSNIIARHMDQGKIALGRVKHIKSNRAMPLSDLEIEIFIM